MKLIRCNIENFGKLKNQRIDFSKGCQSFCYENGWGKSTLAAFLTVMLYGFSNERSRDDYSNERRRYRPWQGGVYGGTLTFEMEGKQYTVERTFGLKEKEDYFCVRDAETNLETTRFSSDLGEEIFGLDRVSFEKTIYLSQKDCATKTTDRIQARIGNLAEATDDMNQYEAAEERLHNMLNSMSPQRKTGSLYRIKEQICEMEAELRRVEGLNKAVESLLKERKQEEKAYSKYKEVQELLLEQQRMIMLEKRDSSVLSRSIERTDKKSFPFLLFTGLFSIMAGIYLSFFHKEAGFALLIGGIILSGISVILFFRKKERRMDTEEYDNSDKRNQDEKTLEERIEEVQQRLRKIQILIENSHRKVVNLEWKIQDTIKKREQLLEKEEKLEELKEQYRVDLVKYERLKMTKDYLSKARETYLLKYRNPIMQSFSKYYEFVSGYEADNVRMDGNLNLRIQELGIQREARYYSEGWKDLLGICMRMALVEVMYQKEKPFFIMDDPFVNLDQKKTEAALDFLKQLGKEYQILYFTCHESRNLEKSPVSW